MEGRSENKNNVGAVCDREDARLDISVFIQAVVFLTGLARTAQACGLLFGL